MLTLRSAFTSATDTHCHLCLWEKWCDVWPLILSCSLWVFFCSCDFLPVAIMLKDDYFVRGAGLPGRFKAEKVEFHWGPSNGSEGSEHSINGRRYPVEVSTICQVLLYHIWGMESVSFPLFYIFLTQSTLSLDPAALWLYTVIQYNNILFCYCLWCFHSKMSKYSKVLEQKTWKLHQLVIIKI